MSDEKKYQEYLSSVKLSEGPTEKIIEIRSDASVTDAVTLLSKHGFLSAPVRDVKQPDSATWVEKYLGVVSMLDILVYALEAFTDTEQYFKKDLGEKGAFLPLLQSAKKFSTTPISSLMNDDRTPFVPISTDSSLLEAMFLMNKDFHFYRLLVVSAKDPSLARIITQTNIVKHISDHLDKFTALGSKTLEELKLGGDGKVHSVRLTDTPITAFNLIKKHQVSAVPVMGTEGLVVGNISVKDARLVVSESHPGAFQLVNGTVADFLKEIYKTKMDVCSPLIIAKKTDTLASVVTKLVSSKIHRVWVVDAKLKVTGAVSLTDVIHVFAGDPPKDYSAAVKLEADADAATAATAATTTSTTTTTS